MAVLQIILPDFFVSQSFERLRDFNPMVVDVVGSNVILGIGLAFVWMLTERKFAIMLLNLLFVC